MNAGAAYWAQHETLAQDADRIWPLIDAVGRPGDLWPFQWSQLMSFALEMRPDLILEFGRGYGNSTCAFTEVARLLRPSACRVVSVCLSDSWEARTLSRLRDVVPADWFVPLTTLRGDLLRWDPRPHLDGARRVLIFWDAHGFEVAEWMLGVLGPLVEAREHAFLIHDMSDIRYEHPRRDGYEGGRLWKGYDGESHVRLGIIDSTVEEAVSLLDFTGRNGLELRSAEHEIRAALEEDQARSAVMRDRLGDLFSLDAGWFWLQLRAEDGGRLTFPRFDRRRARPGPLRRLRLAARMIIRGY